MWIMETVTSIQYRGKRATLGNFMDISERKKAEEALHEGKMFFYGTLNDLLTFVAVLKPDGTVIFANNTPMKLAGINQEEVVGRLFHDTHWWSYSREAKQKIKETIEKCAAGKTLFFEIKARMADNKTIWALYSMHPIFDEDDKVKYLVSEGRDISERMNAEKEEKKSARRLLRVLQETITAMALTIEKRDPYTAGHQQKVAELAVAIAKDMSLPQQQIDGLRMAGIIHDLGKIYVPAEILCKPGHITDAEFNLIKTHPMVSYDILKKIEFPWPIALIILQHHERIDGSGYPLGLHGEDILLEAKIIAVADVVVAIATHRPYRPANSMDTALEEISKYRGVHYDPWVVDTCLNLIVEKKYKIE